MADADNLRKKTVSGFAYKFAERIGAQGINFIISILLARILLPDEYGLIALVTVFITILDVFVTYGFGNSLIADKNSDQVDFSTCFFFGLALSSIVYALVFLFAPQIAVFYSRPELKSVLRVMALRIPIAAINSVQQAYVSKHMMFKKFFYATLIGTIISGVIAVWMAYSGFGVWALVEQYLGNVCMDTFCLWIIVGWRPTFQFSFVKLKKIYSYGWKILVVGLLDTGYSQLRSLSIGKKYSSADLAYYNKGNQFPSMATSIIEPTVNGIMFPSLSQCSDNVDEMRAISRRIIKVSTYLIFPTMIGLMAVAKPLVTIVLTDKWLPCVIYLQICCLAQMFRPIQFINNSIIKASGNSALLLKLDIVKKLVGVILLIISIRYGVVGIAISLVISNLFSTFINIMPNRKILSYGYRQQLKDIGINFLNALFMGIVVYIISFIRLNVYIQLLIQVISGITLYLTLSHVQKVDSYLYVLNYLKKFKHFKIGE